MPETDIAKKPGQRPANDISDAVSYRIGIIGGGQLAKMTAIAALQLGCDVVVLERNKISPAATLATHSLIGDWDSPDELLKLAAHVDIVTLENEFVNAESLKVLTDHGYTLFPSAHTMALIQDKYLQKQTYSAAGIGVTDFRTVTSPDDIREAGKEFGWPMILKKRRNSYDGKGNYTVVSNTDADQAWKNLDGTVNDLYIEAYCPFSMELAVIITRSRNGEMVTYPVVETIQKDHICHVVKAPAEISMEVSDLAAETARQAIIEIDAIGSFGVEMFLTKDNKIILNEIAPRVHNSGHYTIEACVCSQFENHVRAILGWPLGSTEMVRPAAVMVNLLGTGQNHGFPVGIDQALTVSGTHVHIYGKTMSRKGRKMGHVTALSDTLETAYAAARQAAENITFGNKP
jgi:5-(carboxyamino)imidazole ribonucleotide synthase